MDRLGNGLLGLAVEGLVQPAQVMELVRVSEATNLIVLRDIAVGLVCRLLVQEKILVGEVQDEVFVPWSGSTSEVLERIASSWFDLEDPAVSGDELFWIAATDEGRKFRPETHPLPQNEN